MTTLCRQVIALALAAACGATLAGPRRAELPQTSAILPSTGQVEVAFSPREGSEALVLKVIDSARHEIKLLAYSFTSANVTRAVLSKVKQGVGVTVIADSKNNTTDDRTGKSRAALSALANAGADVRLISAYAIHHDKVIVVDRQTVQTGSFNYSSAAAERNSENVLVHWANPQLAAVYLRHFERNLALSERLSDRR